MSFGKYSLSYNGIITSADANFCALTGYSQDGIKKKTLKQLDLVLEEDRSDYLTCTHTQISKTGNSYVEFRLVRKDGQLL